MRRSRFIAGLSFLATVLGAAVAYAVRVKQGDSPAWAVNIAIDHRAALALWLLAVTFMVAALDFTRAYFDARHQTRFVLDRILGELSKTLFPQGGRHNRITLFNCTSGWRVLAWGLVRVPFGKRHKWRALSRLTWSGRYLGVYLRPTDSRGRKSTAAFRVSDESSECEGVAGRIWDLAGQWMIYDLPKIESRDLRKIASQQELEANPLVRDYAAKTNMLNFHTLDVCDHFAKHFYGTLIRKSDGSAWGVLLLDSFEDLCPFIDNGRPSLSFVQRFNDYALIIGKIVS